MARVPCAIKEFELEVHVVSVRGWSVSTFVKPIAGGEIVVYGVRGNTVITTLRLAATGRAILSSTDDSSRSKVGVETILVVGKLKFADIHIRMVLCIRNVAWDRGFPSVGVMDVRNIRPSVHFADGGIEMG